MDRLLQALASAADGAFVINKERHIIYWNQAAQKILGYVPDDVADQPCYEILEGCDDQGRLICHQHCRVAITALNGGSVTNYDARVQSKANGLRWINMSTFTFSTNGASNDQVLVHLFRDVTQKKKQERFIDQMLAAAKNLQTEESLQPPTTAPVRFRTIDLTIREREVLSLLAQGLSTNEIARSLSITSSTVRNHIRNILQKLHVHRTAMSSPQ